VWSKSAIPGGTDPYIRSMTLDNMISCHYIAKANKLVRDFVPFSVGFDEQSEGDVAVLIYEWSDYNKIGVVDNSTGLVCAYLTLVFMEA
jgi:hypothetical protein